MALKKKRPANAATLDRGRDPNHQEYNIHSPKMQPVMRPAGRKLSYGQNQSA